MEFKHHYGCVEMHLEHEQETGEPHVYARYTGAIRQGVCGPVFDYECDTPPGEEQFCVYHLVNPEGWDDEQGHWETWPGHVAVNPDEARVPIASLDAAVVLLFDDYDRFQAAEQAMGDPYP